LRVGPLATAHPDDCFALVVSQPGSDGEVRAPDLLAGLVATFSSAGALAICAADILSLCLIEPPGHLGFDIAVGSTQRFGVPMAFGGPHAAYMAVRDSLSRTMPGRLVGASTDAAGRPALRLALQTREQHIRREKATSNICTSQVLLANVAAMYGVWHGQEGLVRIARHVHRMASVFADSLTAAGVAQIGRPFFDTVRVDGIDASAVAGACRDAGLNIRALGDRSVSVSFDEPTTLDEVERVLAVFGAPLHSSDDDDTRLPAGWLRADEFMQQQVFGAHRTEHERLRYLRRLADKDLALDRTMIPLGSCTMKLNATTEMEPVSWPEFADLHPLVPDDESTGLRSVVTELEQMLVEITGYDAVSLQPNAGSQGEFAGLLAIRAYHRSRGDGDRDVCLIPSSAHGTNAASAVMAGMRVQVVACDIDGNVDIADLRAKASTAGTALAALMITYPSTHGVFEEAIGEICAVIHDHGGQVYVDGANLNALVATARPGRFGADVSHLNLHKTFCIPHGGGGPGVGPVAVRSHLAPHLPNHPMRNDAGPASGVGPISAAPWGSAGILPIPWAYITMMGADGLRRATEMAILGANYVATRLAPHFPVLHTGANGRVAHECILDLRPIKDASGVTVDDVAKRLMDHGFHAPTMSFPVAGTLMVEPTESESLAELDRFCDAMISIREEIARVESGEWSPDDSPLRHAPHTSEDVATDQWDRPYPRELAGYPLPGMEGSKYWPPVGRIDSVHGDRNLVCSCMPIEAYADA
jgi:glycine dehydrogenase